MKTFRKLTLCSILLTLVLFKAFATNYQFFACQNVAAIVLDSSAIGSAGSWSALPGNPSAIAIDSPSSFRIRVTGLSLPDSYWLIWTGAAFIDTVELIVQASPGAPVLSSLGTCLGSDSLVLSGLPGAREIDWFWNGANVHTAKYPARIAACGNNSGQALNQFNYNGSLALDRSGNLYIADWGNSRVLKFPPGSDSTTLGIVVAGGNGTGNGANQFRGATAVYVDAAGYIYVSDYYNNRVQKFPPGSTSATNGVTIAGGNGGGLLSPEGVTGDAAGNIYVADAGNYRIQMFPAGSTSSTNGTTVAGGNGQGSAANQLNLPWSLAVDAGGNLYVSDEINDRIQMFPAGSTSATNGITVAGGNGHAAGADQLSYPSGIYLNSANELYVLDYGNYRVQKFPAGSTSATHGVTVAGGNGSGHAINQMGASLGIALDSNSHIFIFDADNYRVVEIFGSIDSVYVPTQLGYYTASIVVDQGCPYPLSDSVLITVCTPDSVVWPGDADADHIVDNADLLPLGLAYSSTGPARIVQGIVWQGDQATDWGSSFSNYAPLVNYKHTDCNGDGIIDAHDTTAILQNFSLVHAKTNSYNSTWRSGIPGITIQYSQDTVIAGDTLVATILIGDSALQINNLYGLAFTYHYDPIVMDSSSVAFDLDYSWFGNNANTIAIHKDFLSSGTIQAAITGINHTNRSGYGVIAHMRSIITTDNINGKDLSYYTNRSFISDITAIDAQGNAIQLNAAIDSNQVGYIATGIQEASVTKVGLYPNPANGQVKVTSNSAINEITITDVLGKTISDLNVKNSLTEVMDVSMLASGIYIVHISAQTGAATAKLVISR